MKSLVFSRLSILLSLQILWVLPLYGQGYDPLRSVVQVTVYGQEPDYDAPWRGQAMTTQQFLGVALTQGQILVTAFAVAHSTMIEVKVLGVDQKIPSKIELIDYNANLAILKPSTGESFVSPANATNLVPAKIGSDISLGTQASLVSGRKKARLVESPVRLHEIDVRQVITSTYAYAHYLFQVRETQGLGWSEPVFDHQGQLIALTVGQDADTLYAIPGKILRHFWQDHVDPPYKGFGTLGLEIFYLNTPHLKRYIGISPEQPGVMITEIRGASPFSGQLQKFDVLTAINHNKIVGNGLYLHPIWGKVSFTDLVANFYAGDPIELTILRKGKETKITSKATVYDQNEFLMPGYSYTNVSHLIFAGFIFQELSLGFLKTWGEGWDGRAPEAMTYAYLHENRASSGGAERVIILNRVLPDSHNNGYGELKNAILKQVNGIEIDSLNRLRFALSRPETSENPYARLEFANNDGEVILTYEGLELAHERIAKNFNINHPDSFYHHESSKAPNPKSPTGTQPPSP